MKKLIIMIEVIIKIKRELENWCNLFTKGFNNYLYDDRLKKFASFTAKHKIK